MENMLTFREFLQKKAQDPRQLERRERRIEWIAAVDRLMAQLRTWLEESDPDHVLVVIPLKFESVEPELGVYPVSGLKIGVGDASVQVVPVGRDVIGQVCLPGGITVRAAGRVDIRASGDKYILYRTLIDGHESWYVLDERFEATPLDRSRLEALLVDLLS